MAARFEITKKYAAAYAAAPKKGKSQILDQVVEVTGWNRDHARQQLRARLRQPLGRAQATIAVIDRRHSKPRKYSYDALRVLQRVWSTSGGICGKYLAASMPGWLDAMEAEGDLVAGQDRYSPGVRAELESMSGEVDPESRTGGCLVRRLGGPSGRPVGPGGVRTVVG